MIHLVRKGGNYGWSLMEGTHPFQPLRKRGPTPILPPIKEHHHSECRAIIGGLVYHGQRLPELRGAYIYGDHEMGSIWGLRYEEGKITWQKQLAQTPLKIVSFAQDRAKEIYFLSLSGEICRLKRSSETRANPAFPTRLSETGLFTSVPRHEAAPGLIPYSVNSALWSDGASKDRYLALPGKTQITFPTKIEDPWELPEGTVLVKTFSLPIRQRDKISERRIETRLLTKQHSQWRGYCYEWNSQQTEADLVPVSGVDRDFLVADARARGGTRHQSWHFPSRAECMVCHTRSAGFVLGINVLQLNRQHDYGATRENQLRVLERLGIFQTKLSTAPEKLPQLADPDNPALALTDRARAYLHANCAHCHVTDGGGNSRMELDLPTPISRIVNALPQHESYGIADARLIAAGSPDRSLIVARMARLSSGRMPPLASTVVDEDHVKLVRDWIQGLKR
jgi:uncharacterized repeat protein (TIGR03806 family)